MGSKNRKDERGMNWSKETGRKYLGIEIDDKYYKISVDRLNGITASGQTSMFTDFGGL